MCFHLLSGDGGGGEVEGVIVKTIPGNMYHSNTWKINFTKKFPPTEHSCVLLLAVVVALNVISFRSVNNAFDRCVHFGQSARGWSKRTAKFPFISKPNKNLRNRLVDSNFANLCFSF